VDTTETPTTPQATDRLGNTLPSSPTAADVERQADRLRVVSNDELPTEVTDSVSLDYLEERRRRALSR